MMILIIMIIVVIVIVVVAEQCFGFSEDCFFVFGITTFLVISKSKNADSKVYLTLIKIMPPKVRNLLRNIK